MAIRYERFGHSQLYADYPLDRLTFPITRADSAVSDCDSTMAPCGAPQCAVVPALPPTLAPSLAPSSVPLLDHPVLDMDVNLQPLEEKAMNYAATKVGPDGRVPWQHVSEHFMHRWRLEDAREDLKSSKEGKAFVVRVAELLRTCYRTFKGGFKKGTRA